MTVKRKKINYDFLRNKFEQLKNPGMTRKNLLWKPKDDGEQSVIRLIAYPHSQDDDPFVTLYFHYNIGTGRNSNFLCLKRNFNEDCPACSFASKLWQSEDDVDKELAKKIFARERTFAVVLDREDMTKTPKFWGFSRTVNEKFLSSFNDPDESCFLEIENGLDVKVYYVKMTGKRYPSVDFKLSRKETPLASSEKEIQEILNKVPKIDDLYNKTSIEDIQQQLNAWLNLDDKDIETMNPEIVKQGATSLDEDDEKGSGSSELDVDAAFEEALG